VKKARWLPQCDILLPSDLKKNKVNVQKNEILLKNFKRTVSRDEFGFGWHVWLVLGLNRGRGQFLNF
jgi:hypothetical protein